MRVAILQDHLRNGGTEQQTLAIAAGFAASGAQTHVIVFRAGGALDPEPANDPAYTLHFLNQGPLKTDWFAPGLKNLLAKLAPDVVIPMGRMANCHAGLLPNERQYKIAATFRTGRSIPYLYRRALRRADHIVANSQNALERIANEYGIQKPDTSSTIYNGCIRDFDTFIPSSSIKNSRPKIHFCSVSMFRPQKQQIRLIRICSKLPADIDWKLTVAGSGPTKKACEAEVARLNLQDRVEFPGLLRDPRSLYQAADIALHVSDQESLPNFLVEAQMSGLPVIAYDVDGVSETFVHNQSGYLIRHLDEADFIAKLASLARDPETQLQMSKAAREYATENFTLAAQTDAYFQLVKRLAKSPT